MVNEELSVIMLDCFHLESVSCLHHPFAMFNGKFIFQTRHARPHYITPPPAIQTFLETVFNCSQNTLVKFFKVDFNF